MIFSQKTFNLDKASNQKSKAKYDKVKHHILDCIKKKSFGFIEDVYSKNYNEIFSTVNKLKKFDNVLFLGTGGSSLGGKTLVSLVKNYFLDNTKPKIYFIENVDSSSILGLLGNINLDKTACVVISKSGETIETISQFFLILNQFEKKKISIKKKIFYNY